MFLGGAQSMLQELYYAIEKYHPEYEQKVYALRNLNNQDKISMYSIPYSHATMEKVIKKIKKDKQKTVVFFHKLSATRTELYNPIVKSKLCPVFAINHTFLERLSRNRFEPCDVIISVSSHMCSHLGKSNPKANHQYIHNGVNGYRYENIIPIKKDRGDIFLTGRVNRICQIKHSNDWLLWCSRVDIGKKMRHEYIGGGRQYQHACSYSKKITKKNRNDVKMLGEINDFDHKVSIMKNWDVFLYEVNACEGVSMAILEAMALGVPVICSNHRGNIEIIKKGVNGYIFKNRTEAQQILTDLVHNKNKLKELKQSTLEYFKENLDAKFMAQKYIKLVEKYK